MEDQNKFEEELEKELYKEKPSERVGKVKKIWGVRKKEPEKYKLWEEKLINKEHIFNIKKIFFVLLGIFFVSIGVFIFVLYYRSIFIKGINIDIIGPVEVNSLDDYSYLIKISNNSLNNLKNVKLAISLKNGIYFIDDFSDTKIFNIGDLDAKSSTDLKIDLVFIGKINQISKINCELTYYTEKKNQSFQIEKDISVSIKKEALSYQVFKPTQIFIGEPFMSSFKIINNSDKVIGLDISLEIPDSLEIISLSPPPQGLLNWIAYDIQPNSFLEINITSKFKEVPINPVITLIPKIIYKEKDIQAQKLDIALKTLESPVTLKIEVRPEKNLVELGSDLEYKIRWENNSTISLKNAVLKVYLEGPFNYNSINTDGYYSPFENSIIWDARNKSSLYEIKPQTQDYVTFKVKLVDKYPPGSNNLAVKVRALIETESIPPEIQILSKKLSIETENIKIIPGNITLTPLILYKDENFVNSGPFPLQKGQLTTLSFYILISTYGEDFENIIIKTKIPMGVRLTGSFAGEFNPMNLSYNQETGDWIYRIDELNHGFGDIYSQYSLIQQIEVVPPLYGDIHSFVIIPEISLTAKGKYSGKTFNLYTNPITENKLISSF